MLQSLDGALEQLDISSYGVIDTDLEEVFLKVTDKAVTDQDSDSEWRLFWSHITVFNFNNGAMRRVPKILVPFVDTPSDATLHLFMWRLVFLQIYCNYASVFSETLSWTSDLKSISHEKKIWHLKKNHISVGIKNEVRG